MTLFGRGGFEGLNRKHETEKKEFLEAARVEATIEDLIRNATEEEIQKLSAEWNPERYNHPYNDPFASGSLGGHQITVFRGTPRDHGRRRYKIDGHMIDSPDTWELDEFINKRIQK